MLMCRRQAEEEEDCMAYIAVVPPIRFINITSSVGTATKQEYSKCRNNPDDVLIVRAFMIYLQNFRRDLPFTNTRLARLAGSLDDDLSQMILDYKAFKAKAGPATMAFEERGNDRVLPQSLNSALPSAAPAALQQSTIMSLNLEVRPLAGYGDNTVDVMCNLFPIRSKLTVPPLTGSGTWDKVRDPDLSSRDWRDLARNNIPWNQWLRKQREAAISEYQFALARKAEAQDDPTRFRAYLPIDYDEDNEVLALLVPYQNEMNSFWDKHTQVALSTSPRPSADRQAMTVNISVTSRGGQTPQGVVKLWIASRELFKFYGRDILTPSRALELRLLNGAATYTAPADQMFRAASPYFVKADYWPTGGFLESTANIEHEVK